MSKKTPVDIPITATDYASAVISKIENKFEGLNNALTRSKTFEKAFAPLQKIGSTLTSAGRDLTIGVTAPIAGLGFVALRSAANFETTMLKLQAATDAPAEAMQGLQTEALRIGKTTQFAASDAAAAMVELGKAGFSAGDIMKSTQDVVALAGAEFMKMDQAATIVSDTMNQFGLAAADTARISDVLTYAAGKSTTDVAGLAEALKFAGGASRASGISFEETNAALAILANRGMKGSMAGTALSTAFERIKVDPQGIAALKSVGVTFDDLFSGTKDGLLQIKSISAVLKTLENKKMTDRQLFDIFGQESGRAIKQLLGQSGEIEKMTAEMRDGAAKGFAKKQNEIKSMGLEGQLARLRATLEVLMIGETGNEGAGLLGMATAGVQKLTRLISWFGALSPILKNTTYIFAGIAAVLGPVIMFLGMVAGAVVKLGAAWGFLFPKIVSFGGYFVSVLTAVKTAILGVIPTMISLGSSLWAAMVPVLPFIAGFVAIGAIFYWLHSEVVGTFGSWGQFFSDIWEGITALWGAGIQGLKNLWVEFTMWIGGVFSEILAPFERVWARVKNLRSPFGSNSNAENLALGSNALTSTAMQTQATPGNGFGQIQIDFSNMPKGVRVQQSKQNTIPIDLGMGYSMVTP